MCEINPDAILGSPGGLRSYAEPSRAARTLSESYSFLPCIRPTLIRYSKRGMAEMQNRTGLKPKRSSRSSDAIEVAAAVRKESQELCDELDSNLKQLDRKSVV